MNDHIKVNELMQPLLTRDLTPFLLLKKSTWKKFNVYVFNRFDMKKKIENGTSFGKIIKSLSYETIKYYKIGECKQ